MRHSSNLGKEVNGTSSRSSNFHCGKKPIYEKLAGQDRKEMHQTNNQAVPNYLFDG